MVLYRPGYQSDAGPSHRLNRVERWLYNGLQSLDFSFWYNQRPWWDIGMITLLLGGLASTAMGLYLGIQRLRRGVASKMKSRGGVAVGQPVRHG